MSYLSAVSCKDNIVASTFPPSRHQSFGKKKHEIAQVEAQLQAQFKVANLSRKHKNELFK